jgi:hypothetical protein
MTHIWSGVQLSAFICGIGSNPKLIHLPLTLLRRSQKIEEIIDAHMSIKEVPGTNLGRPLA